MEIKNKPVRDDNEVYPLIDSLWESLVDANADELITHLRIQEATSEFSGGPGAKIIAQIRNRLEEMGLDDSEIRKRIEIDRLANNP